MLWSQPNANGLNATESLAINRAGWDRIAGTFHGTSLPSYGPLAQTETELHLLDPIRGARVLEIGCGGGRSLLYLAQQGASEVWGLDLSCKQIENASRLLDDQGVLHHLFVSPMEENPGIPTGYFDLVVSIYALGWSVDLVSTLKQITTYLKPNGRLVFSWEHPVFHCIEFENGQFVVKHSYQFQGPEFHPSWKGIPAVFQCRKLATYINQIVEAGLAITRIVECDLNLAGAQAHNFEPGYWYSVAHAELIPTTMIVAARKPGR
jgi:SAM-dependent methyltransferase